MKIYCKNTLSGLIPLYDSDFEEKKKLKLNETYRVDIVVPRNVEFLKKYFALIGMTFQNQELFNDSEDMREAIIKYAGYFTKHQNMKGEIEYKAKSISFAKMTSEEFERLYNRSITVILKYILKGNTKEEILQEVINFM